jgi:hypothetical protein
MALSLELSFITPALRNLCDRQRALEREFGENYKEAKALLTDLSDADNLGDLEGIYDFIINHSTSEVEVHSSVLKLGAEPIPQVVLDKISSGLLSAVARLRINRIEAR